MSRRRLVEGRPAVGMEDRRRRVAFVGRLALDIVSLVALPFHARCGDTQRNRTEELQR